jgi:citrate synthase
MQDERRPERARSAEAEATIEEAGGSPRWHSELGYSTPDSITVCGLDLADEIMGRIGFADLAFRMVAGRLPDERESQLFNAVLVSLADHGITPTVLAARLTWLGAPESLQGAVAAGLLGAGSVFLGVTEDAARFLAEIAADAPDDPDGRRAAAEEAVRGCRDAGRRVPGLGHPVHKETDPRVPRLYALASELALRGPHLDLLELVADVQAEQSGRRLPINGAGAAGAALADLGFDWRIIRGFALLARTAGLLGHLAEEMRDPIGGPLWEAVEHDVTATHLAAREGTGDR